MKLLFKMFITAILSVLFLEVLIAVLAVTNIITPDLVSGASFLEHVFIITQENTANKLTFNPFFEIIMTILCGLIPLITFVLKKLDIKK